MTQSTKTTNRKVFSTHSYMLVLLFAIIILFSIIALTLFHRLSEVRSLTESETQRAAQEEIRHAIRMVFDSADALGKELASWGEAHQQLQTPQYYGYWREQRLVSARQYPSYVMGVELYDANGNSLAKVIRNNLPDKRGSEMRYAHRINGKLYLINFTPVPLAGKNSEAAGYVGTIWEFVPAMLLLSHFSFLDADTLASTPGQDTRWPAERIEALLHYSPHSNPAAEKLEAVVKASLVEFALMLGILLILVYFGVSRLLIKPLQKMIQRLAAMRWSDTAGIHSDPEFGADHRLLELDTLSDALRDYHQQLATTTRDLDETNRELWTLAHIDALTGAYNRRAFDSDWRAVLETAREQRMHVSFLLFDCDFFKAINDTYGHTTGDRLVQALARLLQQALRKGDKLYRLGGDEFAALLLNADGRQAHQVAERCLERLKNEPFDKIGIQETVRVSVGVAASEGTNPDNLHQLPRKADLAMYHAKRDKHQKIVHYVPAMDQQSGSVISSRVVNAAVDAAHGRNGLEMHYQPIVSASTAQVAHYEALVRVKDSHGILMPGDILPIIDQRGLQVPFDLSVANSIRNDIKIKHLPHGVSVGLNLSAHTLMLPNLVEHIAPFFPTLDRHPVIIEVTETDLITQIQHVTENLTKLREHGIQIALDDFGSGYSSIRYLASMPVDIVKFDIEMIRDLEAEPSRRSVVTNAARMVREAGYQLIAEGIETPAQQELATAMGATHLQGYLFGRPSRQPRPATISSAG